uniref:Uncharacterized protein n=1 Tax=Arundo donax TaxID=35708 RepID=A0A0A9CR04_ARUDO
MKMLLPLQQQLPRPHRYLRIPAPMGKSSPLRQGGSAAVGARQNWPLLLAPPLPPTWCSLRSQCSCLYQCLSRWRTPSLHCPRLQCQ